MLANKNLIEFVCVTHVEPRAAGPRVTLVEGAWAFCSGHGEREHEWMLIEPTRLEHVGDPRRIQRLKAS